MKRYLAAFKEAKLYEKIICNVCPVCGLIFYFLVVCRFSAQDSDHSGSLSMSIAKSIADFFLSFKKEHTVSDVLSLANYFEHPLRKLAHFAEYALLGGFFCGTFLPLAGSMRMTDGNQEGKREGKQKRSLGLKHFYVLNVLFVMMLAACDEFHQYFVPGRYASFWDVILDTVGCIIFTFILYLIFDRKKNENIRIHRTRINRRVSGKSS